MVRPGATVSVRRWLSWSGGSATPDRTTSLRSWPRFAPQAAELVAAKQTAIPAVLLHLSLAAATQRMSQGAAEALLLAAVRDRSLQ
jgi:hypothetical protein